MKNLFLILILSSNLASCGQILFDAIDGKDITETIKPRKGVHVGGPDDGKETTSWHLSQDGDTSKDLENTGAKIEALEVAELEETLMNYGLSTERSEKLGKLMNSYSKIKTKRALTPREKDVFTKELTGMSFNKASSVLVNEGYDILVEKASEVNGADPEAIKELLNEVM